MFIDDALKKVALDYHHRTSRIPYGERVSSSLANHVGQLESILDLGCGDGENLLKLAERTGAKRYVGIDVEVRPHAKVEVVAYDGLHVPFPDNSFEAVSLIDVLHHCTDPQQVLNEAVRVASKVVLIKDHFAFGPITHKMLYWIDRVGNAKDNIFCPGTYFEPAQWIAMIEGAKGRVERLDWPLKTHDLPWRIVGWPELQFTAKIVPVG
jgi:SAM-dependent methyltransferase